MIGVIGVDVQKNAEELQTAANGRLSKSDLGGQANIGLGLSRMCHPVHVQGILRLHSEVDNEIDSRRF